MMLAIKETFKAITRHKKLTQLEMATILGIGKQNFSNKVQRNTFSLYELVKITDMLDMELAFADKNVEFNGEKHVIK